MVEMLMRAKNDHVISGGASMRSHKKKLKTRLKMAMEHLPGGSVRSQTPRGGSELIPGLIVLRVPVNLLIVTNSLFVLPASARADDLKVLKGHDGILRYQAGFLGALALIEGCCHIPPVYHALCGPTVFTTTYAASMGLWSLG
jgi:hypothetical protein